MRPKFILLISCILLPLSSAFAQATAQPSTTEAMMRMLPMFFIVFFIFYFMVIRPQQKRDQETAQLLANLKRGDVVLLHSGIIGKVVGIEDKEVQVESLGSKFRALKSAINKKFE